MASSAEAKRNPPLRPSSSRRFFHRPRSKIARLLLFEKVDYVQWLCTAAAFLLVIALFQAFLPASVVLERSPDGRADLLKELGRLEFGEGIRFVPSAVLEKLEREADPAVAASAAGRRLKRAGLVRPRIALVFADLDADAAQLHMLTLAVALREIGYDFEILALEGGDARAVWASEGFPVQILLPDRKQRFAVDWLRYNGVIVSSLEAKPVLSCLFQEPFKSVPVIWVVYDKTLAFRLEHYKATNRSQLVSDWKQSFARATVVVFPNHLLPMLYSALDMGNYYVIPGSPAPAWKVASYIASHNSHNQRQELGYNSEDLIIGIVGSQFSYSGQLLELALILQAISPVFQNFPSGTHLKLAIVKENTATQHFLASEAMALKFGFPSSSINLIGYYNDSTALAIADIVLYSSFLEEQSFPSVLIEAMSLGKLIIAPDIGIVNKYVTDEVNGYLFSKKNVGSLTHILTQTISNGKMSGVAKNVALSGKQLAKNILASESVDGYAFLLKRIIKLPSEVATPKEVTEIPLELKSEWGWRLFRNMSYANHTLKHSIVDKLEEEGTSPKDGSVVETESDMGASLSTIKWAEEKIDETLAARKRLLEEELKDRGEQFHGIWEDVYRNVKKADRIRSESHERDDNELERTGQPLCIYEPYWGEGAWPFLHHKPLYRGISLITKGRRFEGDDIDASSRLPLLNNGYYRDVLGEYGAFFALANRVDQIHKNSWIAFQSWRVVPIKASLTKKSEEMLLHAIETKKHGDALYFWVRMDNDPRNPNGAQFWSFCDAINAGNCRFALRESLRQMYGMPPDWDFLPPMPADGDSWSVMHSWALPTKSFLEFMMFARMFVDALDAHMYDKHYHYGHCYLSLTKDRHCYSRILELLINVWAYHSARRMVYINPETGAMQEQHDYKVRKGKMWIKWFSPSTLKTMDEDRAEEWDIEHPSKRWLWPSTGEVFWQGILEKERNMRLQEKERRKQQNREKLKRMRSRTHQKALGKYIKPPPEDDNHSDFGRMKSSAESL